MAHSQLHLLSWGLVSMARVPSFSHQLLNDNLAGTGLFKANISPLVAEQYKRTKLFVKTTKTGERVIVDPALTVARIYMVCRPIFIFISMPLNRDAPVLLSIH